MSRLAALTAAARRAHVGRGDEADQVLLREAGLRPLTGGFNNAVYAFKQDGQTYCLKLYKTDERRRAQREWQALTLLTAQGETIHPRSIYFEADNQGPVVVMEFVAGHGLGECHLEEAHLQALVETRQRVYAITPARAAIALPPVVGDVAAILRRVASGEKLLALKARDALEREAQALLRTWLRGSGPSLLLEPVAPVFATGDGNLANCLWDGQQLRLIDFEYSGWSDRAFDLADLVEHIQSRGTPDAVWAGLPERFSLSLAERERFEAARHLFALFWVVTFWREGVTSDARLAGQLQRAAALWERS